MRIILQIKPFSLGISPLFPRLKGKTGEGGRLAGL
jgi:hypothetical protein